MRLNDNYFGGGKVTGTRRLELMRLEGILEKSLPGWFQMWGALKEMKKLDSGHHDKLVKEIKEGMRQKMSESGPPATEKDVEEIWNVMVNMAESRT